MTRTHTRTAKRGTETVTIERVSECKKLSAQTETETVSQSVGERERVRAREWQRLRDAAETETVFA